MKCAHFIHRYWPARGGSEKFFEEISERLAADGNDVSVFTTEAIDIQHYWLPDKEMNDVSRETHNGVDVRRFKVRKLPKHPQALRVLGKVPGSLPRSFFSFPSPMVPDMLRAARSDEPFNIVHATALPYDAILYCASVAAKRRGVPLVYSPFFHLGESGNEDVRKHYTRPNQMKMVKSADMVTVQTDIERDFLLSNGMDPAKMIKLGMGINPSELVGGMGERFREKHGLLGPIVCYIGPKTYDKGTFHLVQAMQKLWAQGDPATLVLAGTNIEDFTRYLEKLPAKVKDNCLMLDYVDDSDKRDMLDACDLLVLPSRSDSFGIVFLEAWYYGKPVVGASAGGIPGLVRDGVDGLLVPFGDVKELALAIQKILLDADYAKELGSAGHDRVLAEFTWDEKYAVVKKLYEDLTGKSAG